ncbi:unnamed protein product, partial [Prorocentrum cordatum]
ACHRHLSSPGQSVRDGLLCFSLPQGIYAAVAARASISCARTSAGSRQARHAILAWRLERPYLIYCTVCAGVQAWLLAWNLIKGVQNHWNLPQWKHHRWEEVTEVTIGVLIVSETLLTLRVVGIRDFFCNCWCVFDLLVAALTVVSVGYALEHVGRHGNIAEANVPLLMLRFVLQPARVFAAVASTWRTRRMQNHVDELRVDFDSLPVDGYTAFQHMQEY